MQERRAATRQRVIYGAVATSPTKPVSLACVVRNFSDLGARVEFKRATALPDNIALTIARKGRSYAARVIWWRENSAGVAFAIDAPPIAGADSDLGARLRGSEKKARQLRRRVRELLGEG